MTGPSGLDGTGGNTGEAVNQNTAKNDVVDMPGLSKAIEILGPRVPANGAGIVIIVIVAGGVLTIVGVKSASVVVVIIAIAIVILAALYAVVILVPQWLMQKKGGQESTEITTTPPDPVTMHLAANSEAVVATRKLADLLSAEEHDAVCAAVAGAAREAGNKVRVDPSLVRGNLFGLDDGDLLRIMPQFDHNMLFVKERTTKMRINEGSTGHAWARCRPNIAVRPREGGDVDSLSADQTARLAPTLQWIISIPIYVDDGGKAPIWILNVDGLEESRTVEELESAVGTLLRWAEQISRILRNVVNRTRRSVDDI